MNFSMTFCICVMGGDPVYPLRTNAA